MPILTPDWTLAEIHVAGAPAVIPTADGPRTIVGTSNGNVIALDGSGKEVWRVFVGATVSTWPTFDDVPGIGRCLLIASEAGDVLCLSEAGKIHWRTKLDGSLMSFNNVAVLRGGDASLVATDRRGIVTGLTSEGAIAWEFHTHRERIWRAIGVGPCSVGDIDGDGRDEVVFSASDGRLYCLDADGSFRWNVYIGLNSQWSSHVLVDFGDGPCVVAGGTADVLRCIEPDGTIRWTQRGVGAGFIETAISVGDIDGDGRDEIVFPHQGRALQAVDGDGELLWSTLEYIGGDSPFGPSIADINGDGKLEIILPQRLNTKFRILDANGALLEEHNVPKGVESAPVIGDVDGDGRLEVLCVTQNDGELMCYRSEAPADADVPWPTSRGAFDGRANRLPTAKTTAHKAAAKTVTRSKLRLVDPTVFGLRVNEIAYEMPDNVLAEVSMKGPDSVVRRAIVGDELRQKFSLEILEPGYHRLQAQTINPSSWKRVGIEQQTITIEGFENEAAEAEALFTYLEKISGVDRRIVQRLKIRWNDIVERFASYTSLSSLTARREFVIEVHSLLRELRREGRCQALRNRLIDERDRPVEFVPWQLEHPWKRLKETTNAPPEDVLERIDILTDQRGHEAVAIDVANLLPDSLCVRVWADEITDGNDTIHPATRHFELRQVTRVPTPTGGMGSDALPDLGNAGLLRVDGSSNARLWIDVLTRDLPAGAYTTTLHFRALTQAGATWDVPIRWTVAPVALPDPMPLHFCNWGYGFMTKFEHCQEAALEDMQDHYTSVFPSLPLPRFVYDSSGKITEWPSWDQFDWYLDRMRPQNVILLPAYPLAPEKGNAVPHSPAWQRAFAEMLPVLVKHLSEKGFDYDRWAFYPVDEPGIRSGSLIAELERYARFVKGLNPKARIYTDPYRGMTVEDHKRLVDVVDIVQPTQYYVVESENTDRIDYLKTTDQEHWIYEARAGVKDDIEPTYYWEQIWTAWEIGFTGVGYWTYCTTGFDLWEAEADYVMVYTGAEGPVPSARWQAIRMGIEDYARLARARDIAKRARVAGDIATADRIEKRLKRFVKEAKQSLWDPAVIAKIRQKLIDIAVETGE